MSGTCKYKRYVANGNSLSAETYTCDELKAKKDQLLAECREKYQTDKVAASGKIDRAYLRFKEEIDEVINSCKCE